MEDQNQQGYGQNNGYNTNGYNQNDGNQNVGQGTYNNYNQANYGYYQTYQQPETNKQYKKRMKAEQKAAKKAEKARRKAEKKQQKGGSNFGVTLVKTVVIAAIFGVVAGAVFSYVAKQFGFGTTTSQTSNETVVEASSEVENNTEGAIASTSTSAETVTMDVSDVVENVMPSIVSITCVTTVEYESFWGPSGSYESESAGSGFIIQQDDTYIYIVTNNHVVEGSDSLTVQFSDDTTVAAEVRGVDSSRDLAVVQVLISSLSQDTMNTIKVATLGSSSELRVGETAIAIGNALGYGQSVTTGVISALDREVTVTDETTGVTVSNLCIQTDAAINPGNSGGALLNAQGEVIGINEVKYSSTEVEGIGYAIPIETAQPIVEKIISRETVSEDQAAYLGIQGIDVSEDISGQYNMPAGVYVAQVVENSPAAQAGMQNGDIIVEFDGTEISNKQALEETLSYYSAGTTVEVVVARTNNGVYEEITLTVTLGLKNN